MPPIADVPEELRFDALKARQRAIRDGFPTALGLRVHRALSWLNRAEREPEDPDARFVFLWIAFNAAYASELPDHWRLSERKRLRHFFARLETMDEQQLLYRILWEQFSQPIRLLIDNPYVYQPFWDHQRGSITSADWQAGFDKARQSAHRALGSGQTGRLLMVVFDRLYTLRNQLVHGGATWQSSVNRDQVRDGTRILGQLVPATIQVMMDNPRALWGDPQYPVVE